MFAHKAPTLEEGTCYQDPFWHYPVHKKLDHEKDFSMSHFWPDPIQLTDNIIRLVWFMVDTADIDLGDLTSHGIKADLAVSLWKLFLPVSHYDLDSHGIKVSDQ